MAQGIVTKTQSLEITGNSLPGSGDVRKSESTIVHISVDKIQQRKIQLSPQQ